jgi:hypothetical protein
VNRVHVAPVSFGLGDLVVSLPAIQAVIAQARRADDEPWLVARSPVQSRLSGRIEGLAGVIDEQAFDRAGSDTRLVDLRDHPLQRDHWWGSAEFEAEFGAMSINDILDRICRDLGVAADFTRPEPLIARERRELRRSVLLVADSDGPAKRWPLDRWASVAATVRDRGARAAALTRAETGDMAEAGIDQVVAPTLGEAVDVLSSCLAVVGVDTGLTHIAVQQGTPTVVLCRAHPVFFRPWPHCRAVVGDPCDEACITAEKQHAHNDSVTLPGSRWIPWRCQVGGRCMESIRPRDVLAALDDVL